MSSQAARAAAGGIAAGASAARRSISASPGSSPVSCSCSATPHHQRFEVVGVGAVLLQQREQPPRLEPHQHAADVEHDRVDHVAAEPSGGSTLPLSPGRQFTDTTVALGKKLNSLALAQV